MRKLPNETMRKTGSSAGHVAVVQRGRQGKVQIKAWVTPQFRKQVKGLALDLDTTVEALVIEQLEALLKRHGQ